MRQNNSKANRHDAIALDPVDPAVKRNAEFIMNIVDSQPRDIRDQINDGRLEFAVDLLGRLWLVRKSNV